MGAVRVIGAPALCAFVCGRAEGIVSGEALDRLEFFAAVMQIVPHDGEACQVYDLGPGGPEAEALAQEIMACHGRLSSEALRWRLGSLRVAAASRVRAERAVGRRVRRGPGGVSVVETRQAHAGFFGLDVLRLTHDRFDGGPSPEISREVFVSGDAVTVLPYDPVRDRVLLVEQFRAGPMRRGDPLPWQLEAVAGRIDPGEAPEECARREALEEAGLALGKLLFVGEYYPSPGAMTEYLYSYIGLCDLPDGAAGVFGVADEAEDIRGHILSFEDLMGAVTGGEIANAPLILTALWLQRERGGLRG